MANERHVAKLQEGVRAWNAWRAQHSDIAPDLSGLDLSVGMRQFGPAQGGPIDLRRADLSAAQLEQATLIGAQLEGASLIGADLTHARLERADLKGADLRGADLEHADLREALLDGAKLCGARLGQARSLTQAQVDRAAGDETTKLPADLVPPREWLGVSQVAKRAADIPDAPHGNPRAILGVGRRASAREIRAAYLSLVKELHPDGRAPDAATRDADERLKLINDAYQELKGFGGRADAKRAERRRFARRASAVFLVGVLSSGGPLFALMLGWTYYAGSHGSKEPPSKIAAAPDDKHVAGKTGTAVSEHSKDASVGREAAWAQAQEQGTREGWERFVEAYPDGEHALKAKRAIAAIDRIEARRREERTAWAAAERSSAKDELERFVEAYPDGEHTAKARQAIAAIDRIEARRREERTAWAAAEGSGAKDELERFVEAYPAGEHTAKARQAIAAIAAAEVLEADRASWAEAERSGAKAALRRYLADFPNGRFAAAAVERVALIEAEEDERDDTAWSKAERRHSKAAYATYLTVYPNGRRARDARVRIAELERADARPIAEPVKTSPVVPAAGKPPVPEAASPRWPAADEPFIGADGRIRR